MNESTNRTSRWRAVAAQGLAALALVAAGVVAGLWYAGHDRGTESITEAPSPMDQRLVLYWYDPMRPDQHFDQPGRSPFMDMALIPKYADEAPEAGVIAIDSRLAQNLGMRVAPVVQGVLQEPLEAVGEIQFNGRDVAVVQTRTAGFVERGFDLAPGDLIARGAPLVRLLVPEWAGAQAEYLALRRLDEPSLIAAARQRLRLLGMEEPLIAEVERSGEVHDTVTLTAPMAGALIALDARTGMSVAAGAPIARINGIDPVWIEVAVPEAHAAAMRVGQAATAALVAWPGEWFAAEVSALLPSADVDSRTLRLRLALPNPAGRLKAGMFARVRFEPASAEPRLLVPSEAVIRTGRRDLVVVAMEEGRYRPVPVRVGREADGLIEILGGLALGEQVVVSAQFLLDSEASLRGWGDSGQADGSGPDQGLGAGPDTFAPNRPHARPETGRHAHEPATQEALERGPQDARQGTTPPAPEHAARGTESGR